MVNINNVYRTVQAIMNKEQRGYISPQNFNYFAALAQQDIFEGYFLDLPHFGANPKGGFMEEGYGNIKKNLREKIDIFSKMANLTGTENTFSVPTDFYRLNSVMHGTREVTEMRKDKLQYMLGSKVNPNTTFPKYIRQENQIVVYPTTITSGVSIFYVRVPATPVWNYVPTTGLFEPTGTVNFELHGSEFHKLVFNILMYAGVSTREAEIVQVANGLLGKETQEEKQ